MDRSPLDKATVSWLAAGWGEMVTTYSLHLPMLGIPPTPSNFLYQQHCIDQIILLDILLTDSRRIAHH